MKRIKRSFTILLAFMLTIGMCVPVFAASITVNNPNSSVTMKDITYKAYRVFDVTYTTDKSSYAYTIVPRFSTLSYNGKQGNELPGYLSNNSAEINGFATAVKEFIEAQGPGFSADGEATAVANNTATINVGDKEGYYIVIAQGTSLDGNNTTVTGLCALTTTDPDATIDLKAGAPTIDKTVKEDSIPNYDKSADYQIGDTVPYKLKATIPSYVDGYATYTYIIHDKMDAGLTLDSASFKLYSDATLTTEIIGQHTLKTTALTDDCTFELTLLSDYVKTHGGKDVYITYNATLNENATMYTTPNVNTVHIEYSNDPYDTNSKGKSPDESVNVYTYQFQIFKHYMNGGTETALAGAEFELYTDSGLANQVKLVALTGGGEPENTYRVAVGSEAGVAAVSPTAGTIFIRGLDADTYYLKETKIPAGYNPVGGSTAIAITATKVAGEPVINDAAVNTSTDMKVPILNNKGGILPSTGGIGTTIFYVVGAALMSVAVVLLLVEQKRNKK